MSFIENFLNPPDEPPEPPRRASPPLLNGASAHPWATRALDTEVSAVVQAANGSRNDRLNEAAYNLGQIVGGGSLDETRVVEALTAAALGAGLEPGETRATIQSGIRAGKTQPRTPKETPWTPQQPSSRTSVNGTGTTPPEAGASAAGDDTPTDGPTAFELGVQAEANVLRVRRQARRVVDAEEDEARGAGLGTRLLDGGSFVLDVPTEIPALWGEGDDALWVEGEALIVVGPPGVGKTTLTNQVVRGRLGLGGPVLGYDVKPTSSKVLYLACDRPPQIARSLRRMFHPDERDLLDERLVIWRGPPPGDFAKHPDMLTRMAVDAGADTVIVDSLKDVAIGLTDDEVGAAYNNARQQALVAGVQVLELHHQTKRGAGGVGQPKTLADVYGSVWLTAGAGSVVLLWGAAGDPLVELHHLKQPGNDIGPLKLQHDHVAGVTTVVDAPDPLIMARAPGGVTARSLACLMFETSDPSPNDRAKAYRRLTGLAKKSLLVQRKGDNDTGEPDSFHLPDPLGWVEGELS